MTVVLLDQGSGTHSHTSGTTEQDVFELTSTQNNVIKGVWLDLNELTQNMKIRAKYKIDGTTYRTFQTINWTTGMDDGVLIEGEMPIDDDFKVTLQSTVTEGATRSVPYEYWYMGIGVGATQWVYTVTDSVTGLPISEVDIWISSDLAGNNIIGSGRTNTSGQITFYLDAGTTVYVWRQCAGYQFTNPDTEIIS